MFRTLIEGLLLGFSTGTICLFTCTPIYLPYLLTEERKILKSLLAVGEISIGRFVSYLAFGAIAGFAGANISQVNRELFTSIAYILLSVYLILSAVRTHQKAKHCHIPKAARFTRNAILLGVLTGINFCPAFLIALSKAVDLGGPLSGMMLFLGFFFGTSVFLIPLAFVGLLSKINEMKVIARIASVLIGVWFVFVGIKGIVHWQQHFQINSEAGRIVDVFSPKQEIVIISTVANDKYFSAVRDSIAAHHSGKNIYFILRENNFDFINKFKDAVFVIDEVSLKNKEFDKLMEKHDYFAVENGYSIARMLNFLRQYTFRTAEYLHWNFQNENK